MKNFKQSFVPAIAHVFGSLLYIIFIFPFDIWKRAAINLAEQKANGSLRISKINSPWPFLSFLKALLFEFIFDMLSFLSYFIGIGVAIYTLIDTGEFAEFLAALGHVLSAYPHNQQNTFPDDSIQKYLSANWL